MFDFCLIVLFFDTIHSERHCICAYFIDPLHMQGRIIILFLSLVPKQILHNLSGKFDDSFFNYFAILELLIWV